MSISYHCPGCNRNWWPYEARDGVCPQCGGGTRRLQEDADSGRIVLRDTRQPTEPLDVLEVWWRLPARDPGGVAR